MARAASRDTVVLGARRKARLEAIVRRASAPQGLVRRARIVLLAHAGVSNAEIARRVGCALNTVRTWRRRFVRGGMPALLDRVRSGRPPVYGSQVRLQVVAAATSVPPPEASVWTHALLAAQLADTGISASQVGRVLAELELRPHRVRGWLNRADDEQFWAQAATVCDLYLRPPPDTVVICIDEKTGIQAKYRKYPERRAAPGRAARREFEYVRNGTVSIIAALQVATGQVIVEPINRNDSATFTGFLHGLDQSIDPHLNIHIVMDNGSSAHLPRHEGLARRAPPCQRHLHPQARVLAGHGRTVVLGADPRAAAPWGVRLSHRPRREDHRLRDPLQPDREALEVGLRRARRPRALPDPPPHRRPRRDRPRTGYRPSPPTSRMTAINTVARTRQGLLRRCTSSDPPDLRQHALGHRGVSLST